MRKTTGYILAFIFNFIAAFCFLIAAIFQKQTLPKCGFSIAALLLLISAIGFLYTYMKTKIKNSDHKKVIYVLTVCIAGAIIICFIPYLLHLSAPNGTTIESREKILNTSISTGTHWTISTEEKIGDYIISAAYSTNNKITLAIFEPTKNGSYKFSTSTNRYAEEIIISNIIIDKKSYDLVWFNGAQTEYAELTYIIDNQKQVPLQFDTKDMKIICNPSPAKEYTISVSYYDKNGNKYE